TLRWRYFWRKSNQNVGVATPPHPNAAQVWNATSDKNRGNLKPYSLRSLARQISSRFSKKYFNLLKPLKYFCFPQTALLLFGESISPNPFP
ncbi:MAG: hypothetical protein IJ362_09530, partial [Oscillospiraceae bacterium]|nr:hypothetical protein [Oscillospiraceae bacterium]